TRGAYEIRISNYAPGRSLVRFFNARTGEPLKKTEGDGDRPAQAVALNHKVEELAELFLREPVKALQRVRFAAPINREGEVVTVAKYDDYLGRQGSPTPRPTETRQKPQRAFTPAFIAEAVKEVIVEEEAEEPNQVYPEGALDEAVDDGDEPTGIIRFPTSR
ncbi:MAG: hypothetical protein KDD60_13050, partial [Bdellovibrionales bacterium]|nr:hypothetical protein [Bdellovibrionales bacterium]